MSAAPSNVDLLLRELEDEMLIPERYSTRSLYGRCEPLILTTLLAMLAILGSMIVCEATRRTDSTSSPPPNQPLRSDSIARLRDRHPRCTDGRVGWRS